MVLEIIEVPAVAARLLNAHTLRLSMDATRKPDRGPPLNRRSKAADERNIGIPISKHLQNWTHGLKVGIHLGLTS